MEYHEGPLMMPPANVYEGSAFAPQEERRPQVAAELNELQMHVAKLREVAAMLIERLAPVTGPSARPVVDEKHTEGLVPLAAEIRRVREFVGVVASDLDNAAQRLEL